MHEQIVEDIGIFFRGCFCKLIVSAHKLFGLFAALGEANSLGGLVFEIDVVKIGKIYVHFAYISVQFIPVQVIFGLNIHQNYIEGFFMRRKLNKKFRDLTPLKDE